MRGESFDIPPPLPHGGLATEPSSEDKCNANESVKVAEILSPKRENVPSNPTLLQRLKALLLTKNPASTTKMIALVLLVHKLVTHLTSVSLDFVNALLLFTALLICMTVLLFGFSTLLSRVTESEAMLFARENYKVRAEVGLTRNLMVAHPTCVDTGAGPNCVRESAIPGDWRKYERTDEPLLVRTANGSQLNVIGVVDLFVRLGRDVVKAPFLVCSSLQVPVLLGTTFTNKHLRRIDIDTRTLLMRSGTRIPIVSIPKPSEPEANMMATIPDYKDKHEWLTAKEQWECYKKAQKARVTECMTIPPHTQAWVNVSTQVNGTYQVHTNLRTKGSHAFRVTNGITHFTRNSPQAILIANMSDKPLDLYKNKPVAVLTPGPKFVIESPLSLNEVLNVHTSKGKAEGEATSSLTKPDVTTVEELDLSEIPENRREEVRRMLLKHQDLWEGKLGMINATEHRIELKEGAAPVHQHPYRAGAKEREFERSEIRKMLEEGVIRPSTSEWASPVVLAPKPDGSLRFCVDYRKVNELTKRDCYPLPRMDDCLDSLGEANIFSTLDANCGYWQLPMRESDIPITAFTSYEGLYEFIRMPFGLTNAPACFQRALDVILAKYRWKTCLVYLDDIVIFSNNIDDHIRHVDEVLTTLGKAGISLRLRKCKFFTKTIKYLGHIVKPGTIEIDQAKTRTLQSLQPPRNIRHLRSFLGFVNVYRRFIRDYTKKAASLYRLLRGHPEHELPPRDEEQLQSFNDLIAAVLDPVILAIPKPGLRYSLDTDASDYQIGCALFQTDEEGNRRPIGFWSRTLNDAERNYSTSEKECLATVYGVTTCRPYLYGVDFDLYTDHEGLRWLMNIAEPSGRLMRWRLRLSDFTFTIHYKKGLCNTQADVMSRLPSQDHTTEHEDLELQSFSEAASKNANASNVLYMSDCSSDDESDSDELIVDFLDDVYCAFDLETANKEMPNVPEEISLEELLIEQGKDKFCNQIINYLKGGNKQKREDRFESFFENPETGLLERAATKFSAVVVPQSLVERVLLIAHYTPIGGHPGGRKLYKTLRRKYYWPGLAIDCYRTVFDCPECARERITLQKRSKPLKLFPARAPLTDIAMDILGPLLKSKTHNKFLLVIVDRFTKLVRTTPLRKVSSYEVAKAFVNDWCFVYGPPQTVLTDNGSQFASKSLLHMYKILGVKPLFTTTYHPQTNGQTERFNRTILSALRKFVGDHPTTWDQFTDALTFAYNRQAHSSTGFPPLDLVLSRSPTDLAVETHELSFKNAKEARMQWANKLKDRMELFKSQMRAAQNATSVTLTHTCAKEYAS